MRQRPTEYLSLQEWEVLSAYVDGEVTASERQQVEQRLLNDCEYRQVYWSILHLQDGLAHLAAPHVHTQSSVTADDVADAVMNRLERSPITGLVSPQWARQCAKVAAGVALLVTAGGFLWRINHPHPQLVISVDEPPLEIPKTIAPPELTSTRKAQAYLLTPGTHDDAYSILLTDS